MIKGVTVTLIKKIQIGTDDFGAPVYVEEKEFVDNVLVYPTSAQEIIDGIQLYGKKAIYALAIPKSDTHDWTDQIVEFYGMRWQVFGMPLKGIDDLVPLCWNTKVMVEQYG